MSYYMEVRTSPLRLGSPRALHLSSLQEQYTISPLARGFRSVYLYPETTWKAIQAAGSSAGINHLEVVSSILFLDMDKSETQVAETAAILAKMGVPYEQWHTGRRGGHFHIPITPMVGAGVPYSQKTWVTQHLGHLEPDLSIYNHTGQYRLPLTVHEKSPGNIKRLVARALWGEPSLTIELINQPQLPILQPNPAFEARQDWIDNLTKARGAGQRTPHLFILACNAVELGLSLEEAIPEILRWNARYCLPAHPEEYVIRKVTANYRQLAKGTRNGRQRNSLPQKAYPIGGHR